MKKTLLIDGNSIAGKEQLHERFAAAFDFPDYYGANLDALFDCLGEIRCEAEIRIINARGIAEKFGEDYAENFKDALLDAQSEFKNVHVEFVD